MTDKPYVVDIPQCSECGCLIGNTEQHDRWHETHGNGWAIKPRTVTVDEMAGTFTGPDSVEWLREHRT